MTSTGVKINPMFLLFLWGAGLLIVASLLLAYCAPEPAHAKEVSRVSHSKGSSCQRGPVSTPRWPFTGERPARSGRWSNGIASVRRSPGDGKVSIEPSPAAVESGAGGRAHRGRVGTLPVFGSSFDARARSLPLRVGSEGIIALRSLNSSMRQKAGVMRQFPTFYKAHHLALALRMSAAGVRLRVRMGYMTPDAVTADGTALWSPDGVERELWSEASLKCRALAAGIRNGDTRVFLQRRGPSRDPVQLELGA